MHRHRARSRLGSDLLDSMKRHTIGAIPRLRGAVALACGLLVAVLPALPAAAHAAYKDSDPKDEATVASPPSSVWAEFTEPPTEDSRLEVYDPCGRRVDAGDSEVMGYRITVSMSADTAGEYTVEWAVVSTVDAHPTSGNFTFTSSGGDACPGSGTPKSSGAKNSGGGSGGSSRPRPAASGGDVASDTSGARRGPGESSARGSDGGGRHGRHKGAKAGRERAGAVARPARAGEGTGAAAPGLGRTSAPGSAEDIPLGGLLVGLGIAALVGLGAGRIYLNIIGPPPGRQ